MKYKARIMGVFVGILIVGATTAFAGGIPMAALVTQQDYAIIIVGKFSQPDFSLTEANDLVSSISGLSGLMGDSDISVQVFSPDVLQSIGFTDADVVKDLVLDVYKQNGYDIYIFLDITKTTSLQPALEPGQSIRIDAYVADFAILFALMDPYLYVASLEVPEAFVSLLDSLLIRNLLQKAMRK